MPFDEPSLDKAYKSLSCNQLDSRLPARFRIDQRFGRGVVLQNINDALPAAYGKAIERRSFPRVNPRSEVMAGGWRDRRVPPRWRSS